MNESGFFTSTLFDDVWQMSESDLQRQIRILEKGRRALFGENDLTKPTLTLTQSYPKINMVYLYGPSIIKGKTNDIKIEGYFDAIFLKPEDSVLITNLILILKRNQEPVVNDFGNNVEIDVKIEYLN